VELDPAARSVRRRRDLLYGSPRSTAPRCRRVAAGRAARGARSRGPAISTSVRRGAGPRHGRSRATARSVPARQAAERPARRGRGVAGLGMPDGHFSAALPARESAQGRRIGFRVSLNVGHEERPLARVASGGELSRVMWRSRPSSRGSIASHAHLR
jgi:hypothetical protein